VMRVRVQGCHRHGAGSAGLARGSRVWAWGRARRTLQPRQGVVDQGLGLMPPDGLGAGLDGACSGWAWVGSGPADRGPEPDHTLLSFTPSAGLGVLTAGG